MERDSLISALPREAPQFAVGLDWHSFVIACLVVGAILLLLFLPALGGDRGWRWIAICAVATTMFLAGISPGIRPLMEAVPHQPDAAATATCIAQALTSAAYWQPTGDDPTRECAVSARDERVLTAAQ